MKNEYGKALLLCLSILTVSFIFAQYANEQTFVGHWYGIVSILLLLASSAYAVVILIAKAND